MSCGQIQGMYSRKQLSMHIIRCKIETFSSEHDVNCIDGGRSSDPRVIASLNRKFQEGFKEDEPHEVDILVSDYAFKRLSF